MVYSFKGDQPSINMAVLVSLMVKLLFSFNLIEKSVNSLGVWQGVSHPINVFTLSSIQWSVKSPWVWSVLEKDRVRRGLTTGVAAPLTCLKKGDSPRPQFCSKTLNTSPPSNSVRRPFLGLTVQPWGRTVWFCRRVWLFHCRSYLNKKKTSYSSRRLILCQCWLVPCSMLKLQKNNKLIQAELIYEEHWHVRLLE
jgi:hypothetical protein